ncbi:hypothetical protein BLGI_4458 [Brevibacillus laterosporus GI-9]|nr:hypothetical protein [Brevibacillus laterosporus]CCF16489.1 hypothetical protein BLGI_4458 [Brevibacillus laterosporus GI-9]
MVSVVRDFEFVCHTFIYYGAGDGSLTRVTSLDGWYSAPVNVC